MDARAIPPGFETLGNIRRQSNDIVTEDLAALDFVERYQGVLRYCHDSGRWFEWDKTRW